VNTEPIVREALTVEEAAQILGISRRHLYRLIQTGQFECPEAVKHLGGKTVIARPLLMRWLGES
jgi:excisionase family DNA binding protein